MNTHGLTKGDTKAVAEVGWIANLTEKELNDILKEVIAAREEVGQVYDRHSRACNTVEETGFIFTPPSESRLLDRAANEAVIGTLLTEFPEGLPPGSGQDVRHHPEEKPPVFMRLKPRAPH